MSVKCTWPAISHRDISLPHKAVHAWCVSLDVGSDTLSGYARDLSPDEMQRAERFHFDLHRHRFIACRSQLRRILSKYLCVVPRDVAFQYSPLGKPALSEEFASMGLRFNVSKSQHLALVAVATFREVGIDIEQVRDVPDAERIARRYFSPDEHEQISKRSPAEKNLSFLHVWTRKEAILKALGAGLTFPLDQVTVPASPTMRSQVISIAGDSEGRSWQLASLSPAPDFVAALATPGERHEIESWKWTH